MCHATLRPGLRPRRLKIRDRQFITGWLAIKTVNTTDKVLAGEAMIRGDALASQFPLLPRRNVGQDAFHLGGVPFRDTNDTSLPINTCGQLHVI